jgi:hypothetical protein
MMCSECNGGDDGLSESWKVGEGEAAAEAEAETAEDGVELSTCRGVGDFGDSVVMEVVCVSESEGEVGDDRDIDVVVGRGDDRADEVADETVIVDGVSVGLADGGGLCDEENAC